MKSRPWDKKGWEPLSYEDQWCSRDRNLRDWDLAQTSRPRLCHKSRDRDLKAWDREWRPHISLMVIKANSLQIAAKNIWNVAKHPDKGVCRRFASINLFWLRKIWKLSCSLKTLLTTLCKDRTWCPDEASMFWPATQYWGIVIWERGKEANDFFLF